MVEKPILFSALMVRALLQNRKTQTRRVVKGWPNAGTNEWQLLGFHGGVAAFRSSGERLELKCPVTVGTRLWVRETWCQRMEDGRFLYEGETPLLWYAATTPGVVAGDDDGGIRYRKDGSEASPWKPSIHMARWASRITLEVVDVRLQRVQEITAEECIAEGLPADMPMSPDMWRESFAGLWDAINAKRGFGWHANPWVWAYTFKVVKP